MKIAIALLIVLGICGCDAPATMDTNTDTTSITGASVWCTPDGHANWVENRYTNYAIAVPRLDENGKPVMCHK